MVSVKTTIPMDRISDCVYKTFVSFGSSGSIKTSEFLAKLSVEKFIADCEMIRFSKLAMIKSLILMELEGIKSHLSLSQRLKSNDGDAINLGFHRGGDNKFMIPDQRSFSYFTVHKLSEEEKQTLTLIVEKILKIAEKFDIRFSEVLKKEAKHISGKTTLYYHKEQQLVELSRKIKKIVYPKIKFEMRHNSKYTKNNILDVLVHSALEGCFTHGGALSFKKQYDESPASNTILYHLKKNSPESIKSIFIRVSDEIFRLARSSGMLKGRKFDVSIDYTFQHYYGDRDTQNIVFSKPDRGTSKYFKYATIDIVEKGSRFTLCAFPVFVFSNEVDVVRNLLEYAKSRIKINRVYMDRGFANGKVFRLLDDMKLSYVIPLPEDSKIKKICGSVTPPFVIHDYERGGMKIKNLVIVEGKKGLMKIATNIPLGEKDVGLIQALPRMYSKRWGIETGYRIKKREGFVKTTSRNYAIRFFYFMFSVALYNLWILIDRLICFALNITGKVCRATTFKLFLKSVCVPEIT